MSNENQDGRTRILGPKLVKFSEKDVFGSFGEIY
jgi:hypothetical protein